MRIRFLLAAIVTVFGAVLLAGGLELLSQDAGREQAQAPSPVLTAQDKELLAEALRVKKELGDDVWPGFAAAAIPLIIYNDGYEFLTGAESPPPSPWARVKGDEFAGRPYDRRTADHPQAFAVKVGKGWAASMTSLEVMNRKAPFKISRDIYVVFVLHEAFHAYEALESPGIFRRALDSYALEKSYPAGVPAFKQAWTAEGGVLARALKAADREGLLAETRAFLESRASRRKSVPLSPELTEYERGLEWLEGLAKYAEVRSYELAAARRSEPAYAAFKPGRPFGMWDAARLEKNLGAQEGDLRFYLSGMAQAMILDRLSPGWKDGFFKEGAMLEDRIRTALEKASKSAAARGSRRTED